MLSAPSSSSFARLSPRQAQAVLALTAAAILFFVGVSLSPAAIGIIDSPQHRAGDVDLYVAEIQRVAGGENYYDAAAQELHARNYPTRSIFNWRTPLPMWLLGTLKSAAAGRALIGILAALLLALAVHVIAREGGLRNGLIAGLALVGGLMPCWLDPVYVMPVIWAGVLIGISICLYAIDRREVAIVCGLLVIFVRELATPYCVVCFAMAIFERRWREVFAWMLGISAFLAFYGWHAHQVLARVMPTDRAHAEGWLQYGGAAFVIAVAQMNAFLLLLPQWMTAIFLPLAILGFAGWNTPAGRRAGLTACAFIILFAFVGQPFNQYWGSLIAPLLCLGIAQAPTAVLDLARRSGFKMRILHERVG